MNIADELLLQHTKPSRVIYTYGEHDYKVSDVQQGALRMAVFFRDHGVTAGHVVILRAADGVCWSCSFWALTLIGARSIVLLDNIDPAVWQEVLDRYHIDFVISDRDHAVGSIPCIDIRSAVDTATVTQSPEIYDYAAGEPLLYWASSGTNGNVKLIAHTNQSLWATALGLQEYYRNVSGRSNDTVFCAARMAFSMGWTFNVLGPLVLGYRAVIGRSLTELRDAPGFLHRHAVNHVLATPYVLDFLARTTPEGPWYTVRSVTSSAESLPPDLSRRLLQKFRVPVFNLYGSSELLIVSMSRQDPQPNSVGNALPHVELRIVDRDLQPCAPGVVGVIQVRSPSQFVHYLDDNQSTNSTILSGWVHTMDMGVMDHSGDLTFMGRANACVKIHGQWISLAVMEHMLLEVPGITDCVIVADDCSSEMSGVTALVVSPHQQLDVRSALTPRLRNLIRTVQWVTEIPRTVNMKKIRNMQVIQQRLGMQ